MAEMDETTIENIAALEGQMLGQRLVLAMLIHAARTGAPFDLVWQEINSEYQPFADSVLTMFPAQRMYFLLGMRSGLDSTVGMATAVAEIMAAKGHGNPG